MAALSSVRPPKSSSPPQPSEPMAKLLHSFSEQQIHGMAKLVAGFVVKEGVLQFNPEATVQYQDDDADVMALDVPTKLEEQATILFEKGLNETIRNGALSVFAKGKALEYTFQDILDISPKLAKQVHPNLYSNFSITISIQVNDKGAPVLVFVVGKRSEQYPIDF